MMFVKNNGIGYDWCDCLSVFMIFLICLINGIYVNFFFLNVIDLFLVLYRVNIV